MDTSVVKEYIRSLVEKFERDKYYYLSKDYLEAQTRQDFIGPLFEALGWDISNKAGLPPFEREVLVEKGETTGRPDYNFRVGGISKFFVEVKAPSEPLDKVAHILQAKSYAWNTKEVFIVVLTDFEELKIFDASLSPDRNNPLQGLIIDLRYTEYIDNIEKLLLLSREAVAQGSLEGLLLRDARSKRQRIPVDKKFLQDMSLWREELAKDIYKRNTSISVRTLNEVVQRLLDRIVFIRIAEDRRIIAPRTLYEITELWKAEGKKRSIQYHLNNLFREINADLNGDIFKSPHACEQYEVDSPLLASIIEDLYFPNSPYLFDVIGVELLGSIYERYLGNTIRATPGGRVKVEEKPEVRKAGGVYYTPQYIVKYIVENTVCKLIAGKTPKQIEKIRILDPACGSGSFLLGAFQYLIDYHIQYYREHPREAQIHPLFPYLLSNGEGSYRLSIIKKGHILRNNIFGVDIDPQAVEITMMSLYLKELEDERNLPRKQGILPILSNNIKCGNSLIGYDIFNQGILFPDVERERINPFDWNSKSAGFGEIMTKGGFDCVIGNPPYIRIQQMKEWAPVEVEMYKKLYTTARQKNYDIYVVFVEKGLSLLKSKGYLGFILPNKFMQQEYGENLRSIISSNKTLYCIVNFTDQQVFEGATNYTCLLFLRKSRNGKAQYTEIRNLKDVHGLNSLKDKITDWGEIDNTTLLTEKPWYFSVGVESVVINKISKYPRLGEIAESIFVGLQTSADSIYILEKVKDLPGNKKEYYSKAKEVNYVLENDSLKPLISGVDCKRYVLPSKRQYIIFPYKIINCKAILLSQKTLKETEPLTYQYLLENKRTLESREKGKFAGKEWYKFGRSQNIAIQGYKKICVPRLVSRIQAFFDGFGEFYLDNVDVGGVTLKNASRENYLYVTGLLNSHLLTFFLRKISTPFRGGFYSCNKQYLSQLPIRTINFGSPKEKALHNKLVALVDRMLELNKKKQTLPISSEREAVEREIAVTDEKIDDLVYELYGITDKERKIIEASM